MGLSRRIVSPADLRKLKEADDASALDSFGMAPSDGQSLELPSRPDSYQDALLKLVPPEFVASFLTIDGIIRGDGRISATTYWVVTAIMVIVCILYVRRISAVPKLPTAWGQVAISTLGFVVWVHAIGGPFEYSNLPWYSPSLAGIAVVLFTLAAPVFRPRDT